MPEIALTRRSLLNAGALATGALALGPSFWKRAVASAATATDGPYGPLQAADANGIRLPAGFRSRVIARANVPVENTAFRFPVFPDGQATFAAPNGGFILVTNSESLPPDAGTSAIRFDGDGRIVNAYRILGGTRNNCAGGPTPWGTWLSCEEFDREESSDPGGTTPTDPVPGANPDRGAVFECDPTGSGPAIRRPALGLFSHEAVAVDSEGQRLYLTEDNGSGLLYRFTPTNYPDLDEGLLEALVELDGGRVVWREVPNPQPGNDQPATRVQVPGAKKFARGEGIWFDSGVVYVATTSDSRLYALDVRRDELEVIYHGEPEGGPKGPLTDVDNIVVSPSGDLFACEDNGEGDGIDIALLTPDRTISRFLQLVGEQHRESEATGPIFDPSGRRFFFTSQRGAGGLGVVYEITGPFRVERPGTGFTAPSQTEGAASPRTTGQAVTSGQAPSLGEARLVGTALGVELPRRVRYETARKGGIPIRLTLDEPATVGASARGRLRPVGSRRAGGARRLRRDTRLGSIRRSFGSSGPHTLRFELPAGAARVLRGRRKPLRLLVEVTVTDGQGNHDRFERTVLLAAPVGRRRTPTRA